MHARVVRFTGVTPERISEIVARVEEDDGPPPGVDPVGMELFFDDDQGTALFVGYFETEEKMRRGGRGVRRDGFLGDPRQPCLGRPV